MQQPVFIRLENTFESAMTYRNSPQMEFYSFGGVQLMPNNDYPYIQRTYADGGIEIEDYTVWVCDMCGNRLSDITPFFEIVSNFDDPDTGTPQLEWKLIGVEYDAGYQLIYLEIQQGVNDFKYSSPFYLTAEGVEFTSRVDYRSLETETMYSTGLQIWYKQDDELMEQSTYDTISTGKRTAVTTKLVEYEVWQTSVIDITVFRRIKQTFRNKYVYIDYERAMLFEPFETPRLEAKENFAEAEILLCRDASDKYDPLYVPPIPPDPPVDEPFINLIRVDSIDAKNVLYTFEFGNFEPTYLQYQYSLDGVAWTTNTSGITSPATIVVINNNTINFYYRIYHAGTDTSSNIVQLAAPSIEITNITSEQSSFVQNGNVYWVYYNSFGFIPNQDYSFDGSFDGGVTWVNLYYNGGYQNPKKVTTPSSGLEFTKFRVKYNPMGIISNTFDFSF